MAQWGVWTPTRSATSSSTATTTDGGSSGASTTGAGSDTSPPTTGDAPKFDVGNNSDLPGAGEGGNGFGCQKIDFLFVVDNSGSMGDEQQSLASSFPGFIQEMQNTVMAQDYHIMVVDTDAATGGGGGCFISNGGVADCNAWCADCLAQGCSCTCNNTVCMPPASGECDTTLGGGKTANSAGTDCGITSGARFMLDDQPDLANTFSCIGLVGTGGDGNEKPMEALVQAVTALNAPAQCNEGFLRDDAILVVTFITDEEDNGKSSGNPAAWHAALVAAKNGDENAVVMLGLVGDPDVAGGTCANNGAAEASPNLRNFAGSFGFGSWGSICAPDYTPFFHDAVAVIDSACDGFTPPG